VRDGPGPAVLLDVKGVERRFPVGNAWLYAVDDVSLTIGAGECVGLVGESGCGKSTLVKLITRLLDPSAGSIVFDGRDIGEVPAARFARAPERALIQMVFQDPTDSLNPRFTAFDTIADPIRRLGRVRGAAARSARVRELADMVGLPEALLGRFPHQLSGGQKQRVGIARAIALEPKLLVLDEPTSALDVSVQAVILKLLDDLRRRLGISYLFVSHDLGVVRLVADRIVVMYLGRIVEAGPVDRVFAEPGHPYTRALLSSVPRPERRRDSGSRFRLVGEPRSPIDPSPTVCRFYGRCPEGFERCEREMPALRSGPAGHAVACHLHG
jgi:oligopeptide/dipeptide ABC transporter ATP-binding protein